ncbi:MAG TPA: 23S rRNA (uracil(1939)-C(5))-methyltransferase RlmD [Methylomusa anaerophila]|uniref:23S rRNA (Uracil-C(5))-methyltransferase RlmCD n=1 Tax=Methylomusa anaerophila TaxID=1930071 RepID=A0A348AMT4_9FIRM|nr:23S rRNA (uracil(1939)-C(5))-methyltransferase RlmD [Methylomusa anaerophila]BBB92382.1 23S rRNA (uracil-C(5))-methyltransferase RlmCD [Methylomusa anaerophila]HML89980.1 23S rRNA (uracil(1939)-C(5))-methyltransferase RlmD [Methylomusa anaerophila]
MAKQNQPPVIPGQTYTIDIVNMGHSGEGVGRYEDFTVFVPQALPRENVAVKIITVKKNYAVGKLTAIHSPSPSRIVPECHIFEQCGGCQLQHLSYPAQLEIKRQQVLDAVNRIGKLPDVTVHPTIGAADPWFYRNKMQFPVGSSDGQVVVGCYARGTHDIIGTDNCLIQHQANNIIAREVRAAIAEIGISTYNEHTGQGVVRHVLGRVGTATGEIMVVLVTASETIPRQARLIHRLHDSIPGLVSIVQNINNKRTNIILGDKTITLWGQDAITDRLGEFTFEISAGSFFQVNTIQAEKLYNKAVEYAGLTGCETVIDAYCGTGTITLFLARHAGKVYGIEIVESAILDARRNAAANNVSNAEFIVGDAVDVMPKMYRQGIRPQVIVVDPPRAGCDCKVLETFMRMEPQRMVYVSCNPASLARDLAILAEGDYVTREIQPVDMFPQTYHVETIIMMTKCGSEDKK